MGGFGGGSSNSFEQMPTGASPTTTSGGSYPPLNVRAGLTNNGYGRSPSEGGRRPLRARPRSLLCSDPQTAPSRGRSTPSGQRRQCGPSGRVSSRRRIVPSNSRILRGTSRTCSP